jgi:adenylosuccinate synthase
METKKIKKIIYEELNQNELDEGFFDSVRDKFSGLKGVWRGEGYDYYKKVSSLSNISRDLKNLDTPNKKIMNKLAEIKNELYSSKMSQDKKDELNNYIDKITHYFSLYTNYVDVLDREMKRKLN